MPIYANHASQWRYTLAHCFASSDWADSVARLIHSGFLTKEDREKLIAVSTRTSELLAMTSPKGLLQIECFLGSMENSARYACYAISER